MSVLVSFAIFCTVTDTLFWDLPGDDLAAPESGGWKGVMLCLSLSRLQLITADGCRRHSFAEEPTRTEDGLNRKGLLLLNAHFVNMPIVHMPGPASERLHRLWHI